MKYTLLLLATSLPFSTAVIANDDCPILPSTTEQFAKLDNDSDTVLSKDEFTAFQPVEPCLDDIQTMESEATSEVEEIDTAVIFAMLDTDESGTLNFKEFRAIASKDS